MKLYTGTRTPEGCRVRVQDGKTIRRLRARLDLWNHSPTGFEWGYGGSGPAQLALAILADLYTDELAVRLHQPFKFRVIAGLPSVKWTLTSDEIERLVQAMPESKEAGL